MRKPKIIAYYLPQFHPITENDRWWGKGFTEWTNVGKAKPLFSSHYQPRVPADLGYYDLRMAETRELQAKYAQKAGIYGFCYWHYWFGKGKQLLERPFNEVLEKGKPEFPFCLGWANESWKAKNWNKDHNKNEDKILIEQTYPGETDYILHFHSLLKAFQDPRYIYLNGKPLFIVYKPKLIPDAKMFINLWNKLAKENGIMNGFHFVARANSFLEYNELLSIGFNAVTIERLGEYYNRKTKLIKLAIRLKNLILRRPQLTIDYSKAITHFSNYKEDILPELYPSIIPNWDHSPRSGGKHIILHKSSPELFRKHVKTVIDIVSKKQPENQIIFLKSWNEWAEGNYLEPDMRYGDSYIKCLGEEINLS